MTFMDLTTSFPRSPRAELDGAMILPRAIDKARAELAGALGEYVYWGCPINRMLFNTLGVTEAEFLDAVRGTQSDEEVQQWIRDFVRPEPQRISEMNDRLLRLSPTTPEQRQRFKDELELTDPGNTSVTTWVDLIDLEEGRIPKQSSTAT